MTTQAEAHTDRPPPTAGRDDDSSAQGVSAGFQFNYVVRFGLAVACGAVAAGALTHLDAGLARYRRDGG